MTESQIIHLNELYITGLRGNGLYFIFIHFKDFSVATVDLSVPDSLPESTAEGFPNSISASSAVNHVSCSVSSSPFWHPE